MMLLLLRSSKRATINMVVLATIDIESSLRNTENLITTESASAREFGEELGRALSICVEDATVF